MGFEMIFSPAKIGNSDPVHTAQHDGPVARNLRSCGLRAAIDQHRTITKTSVQAG